MLVSRSVRINGRRTSLKLVPEFWEALDDIAAREKLPVNDICCQIDTLRGKRRLCMTTRVFIVSYFRMLAQKQVSALNIPVPVCTKGKCARKCLAATVLFP